MLFACLPDSREEIFSGIKARNHNSAGAATLRIKAHFVPPEIHFIKRQTSVVCFILFAIMHFVNSIFVLNGFIAMFSVIMPKSRSFVL